MAAIYYQERLYADSAYYLFNVLSTENFFIGNLRLVLAIWQIPVLLAVFAGAGMKTILVIFSISHVLFYYLLFLLILYRYRFEAGAVLLILFQVAGGTWLFFTPSIEMCYGAALSVLFYALLCDRKRSVLENIIMNITGILVLTSHPGNFILYSFLVAFDMLRSGFDKKSHLLSFLVLISVFAFKLMTLNQYESEKVNIILNAGENFAQSNMLSYIFNHLKMLASNYTVIMILMVINVFWLFRKKMFRMLTVYGITILSVIVLVNLVNPVQAYSRYNETLYFPMVAIVLFTCLTVVREIIPVSWKIGIVFLLSCLFVFRIHAIIDLGGQQQLRTIQMEKIISRAHELGISKVLMMNEHQTDAKWDFNWSYPIESLLISSTTSPDSTVSIVTSEDWRLRDRSIPLTASRFILRRWDIRDDNSLLSYFNLRHGNYVPVNID